MCAYYPTFHSKICNYSKEKVLLIVNIDIMINLISNLSGSLHISIV